MDTAAPAAPATGPTPGAADTAASTTPAQGKPGRAPDGKFASGKPPAPPEPAAPPPKIKVKYKDDGKDFEEELGPEEIAIARRQQKWAQRSAEERAKLAREFEQLRADLKDPRKFWDAAKQLGHDPDALAEERVVEKYKPQTMTPEERRQWEYEQKLRAKDEELTQYKTKEQQAAEDREAQAFRKHIDERLGEVAQLGRVPKNPRALARLADVWEGMHDNGYEPSPKELESALFSTYQSDFNSLRGDKKGQDLLSLVEDLMGPDCVAEVQRAALARWREKKGQPQQAPRPTQRAAAKKPDPRGPRQSFDEAWASRFGG